MKNRKHECLMRLVNLFCDSCAREKHEEVSLFMLTLMISGNYLLRDCLREKNVSGYGENEMDKLKI